MRAVLERDFLSEASRTRAVVLRTVLGALVSATIGLLLWWGTGEFQGDRDRLGSTIFIGGAIALLVLLALLTPPIVVGSVLSERQGQTLSLVLATPVGHWSFAAAKLLSRWSVAMLTAFAALPCLAITTLYGGTSGRQVAGVVVLSLALSLEMAAWSLWLSTVTRRLATAAVLSFVLPVVRWILTGFLAVWIENSGRRAGFPDHEWWTMGVLATTPLPGLLEIVSPGILARMPGIAGATPVPGVLRLLASQPWWAYMAAALLAAAASVAASGLRLRSESEPREPWISRTKWGRRWFRGAPPGANPVLWKEVRLLNTATSRPLYYGVLAVMILTFGLGHSLVEDEEAILGLIAAMLGLVAFVAAVNGAACLGHERSEGGYDLLRATLLTPVQIVRGKIVGVLVGLGLLAAIPVATAGVGALLGTVGLRSFVGVALATVCFPGFWAVAGLWSGIRSSKPRTAIVRVSALFAVLLIGLPLAGSLVAILPRNDDLGGILVVGSPPAAAYCFMDWIRDAGSQDEVEGFGALWTVFWTLLGCALLLLLPRALAKRLEEDRVSS